MSRGEGRKTGANACKVCNHPGRQEIDAMLLNAQAKYKDIIARMLKAHPGAPELNEPNLTRHKKAHLLTQPIKTTTVDPETGEEVEGYVIGHLSRAITVPKEALSPEGIPMPLALNTIIQAGIRNILQNPELVSPIILMQALEMARKLGIGGSEEDEFKSAWEELGKKRRVKKTTKTTVTKEVEVEATPTDARTDPDIIDVTPSPPSEWSADDLALLPPGDNQ
jgi:hypothetical protein